MMHDPLETGRQVGGRAAEIRRLLLACDDALKARRPASIS
jgi:hypothetical protein